MTDWNFDDDIGGTFAEDVPLEQRLAAAEEDDTED